MANLTLAQKLANFKTIYKAVKKTIRNECASYNYQYELYMNYRDIYYCFSSEVDEDDSLEMSFIIETHEVELVTLPKISMVFSLRVVDTAYLDTVKESVKLNIRNCLINNGIINA